MYSIQTEAHILGKYLIGQPISDDLAQRYQTAINKLDTTLNPSEEKLWKKCLNSPTFLSYIDSGLALADAFSKIRFRIYIMFCILETTPEYAKEFLPRKRSAWYFLQLGFEMAIAAFKGITGLIIIKLFFNARND